MEKQESIKIFEEKRIRTLWDEEQEKWYFSVVDVVQVLTDSVNPTDYLKKMRKRDPELGKFLGTNCPQVAMMTETGKLVISSLNSKSEYQKDELFIVGSNNNKDK
jgi:hypothetical protein